MLTTVSTVKQWLGISSDVYDAQLETLIAGVDEQVKRYCNRNFETGTFVHKSVLDHDTEIVLDETPVLQILYCCAGSAGVMDISYAGGNFSVSFRSKPTSVLTLVSGMTATEIAVTPGMTFAQLAALIEAVPGWTADVLSVDDYPAISLLDQETGEYEDADVLTLQAATSAIKLSRAATEGVYHLGRLVEWPNYWPAETDGCPRFGGHTGGTLVIVYTGGYAAADIPAGLTLEVLKICCDAWRAFPNNAAMKSESVGDYSYTKWDTAQIASAIGPHMAALDLYRRV